ncbi:MAG: nickel pincer cofactor biosynthesis protein LarB [Desulfovibrio sp.]|jgi:NCAIR mutase (PurE)-related protein|nr:nickel pincer cofactor biosynthesis protein LarB [Desulfovibrio sp.]
MSERTMHGILFDHARAARIGLPEAVFCEHKSRKALLSLLQGRGLDPAAPLLFTRLAPEIFHSLPPDLREKYCCDELARTAYAFTLPKKDKGRVAVVSAGTADGRVTWEAARTLDYLGIRREVYEDNGVAGLWRLASNLGEVNSFDVVIVVAGLDAALASVMGGLTGRPIFAVPTSVGYGMARAGEAALACMLVSCAPGIAVMNIDNGYGAACAAARVINLIGPPGNDPH